MVVYLMIDEKKELAIFCSCQYINKGHFYFRKAWGNAYSIKPHCMENNQSFVRQSYVSGTNSEGTENIRAECILLHKETFGNKGDWTSRNIVRARRNC